MRIKVIAKLPRLITIPGELDVKKYRQLQKYTEVEVDDVSGNYLVERGFAEIVKAKKESKQKEEVK